jgi:DME family drug/metabolite transporter
MAVAMAAQFGIVVVLGRKIQAGGPPFVMLAFRFGLQSLLLFGVLLLLRRPLIPARGERYWLLIGGGVGYATESALGFLALNHAKAGAASLLFYTYPVMVLLGTSMLARRAPERRAVVALGLALVGMAVVVVGGGDLEASPLGIAFSLGSAAMYTAYLLLVDRKVRQTDALTSATWLGIWAAAGNACFALVSGSVALPSPDVRGLLPLMALFSAGAFAAMFGGLRRIGPVRVSIIGVLEPVTVSLLAVVLLEQSLVGTTITGGMLILAGAVTAMMLRTPRTPEPVV